MSLNFTKTFNRAILRCAVVLAGISLQALTSQAAATKPVLTITATGPLKSYGTSLSAGKSTINFKVSGLKTGDAVTGVTLTPGAEGILATTAAGKTYKVNASLPTGSAGFNVANYTIVYVAFTGTVKKAAVAVTATGPLKAYGTALAAGRSASNFTAAGLNKGELINSVTLTPGAEGLSAATAAGKSYAVNPSAATGSAGFLASNYTITYTTYRGVVSRLNLVVTATGPQKIAGTALTAGLSATNFTSTGIKTGELVTGVTLTPDAAGLSAMTAAGKTYVVKPSAATGKSGFLTSNYSINYVSYTGKVKAQQAAAVSTPLKKAAVEASVSSTTLKLPVLTITATGPLKSYGTSIPAGKSTVNFKVSGLKTGDAVTGVTLTPGAEANLATTAAGKTYKVNASLPTGSTSFNAANYTIVYVAYTGTVTKAALSVTATGPLKAYGAALTTGKSTTNFTVTGLSNGELINSVTLTPGAEGLSAATAAGKSYAVNPSAATGSAGFLASNYTITYSSYRGVVSRLNLVITATGPQKVVGTALTAGLSTTNFTSTGINKGELVTGVTLTPDAAGLSALTAAGKAYVVNPSAATGKAGFLTGNYLITYLSYTGKVKAKPAAAFTGGKNTGVDSTISLTSTAVQATTDIADTAATLELTALSINSGSLSPFFSPQVHSYSVTVSGGVSSVNFYLEASDSSAKISLNGQVLARGERSVPVQLLSGSTTEKIEVVSAGGNSRQVYSVQINRAGISGLSLAPRITNILTPNGDGINDYWLVQGIEKYPNNTVTVRSLSGQIVYLKKGYTNDWNGSFHGATLSGTYLYTVDFGTGSLAQGTLTILKN